MEPFAETMPGTDGTTTSVLIERWGPITARGSGDGYQFIAFANGLVYESFRFVCSDNTSVLWLPWSRRPCHDVARLARCMNIALDSA